MWHLSMGSVAPVGAGPKAAYGWSNQPRPEMEQVIVSGSNSSSLSKIDSERNRETVFPDKTSGLPHDPMEAALGLLRNWGYQEVQGGYYAAVHVRVL